MRSRASAPAVSARASSSSSDHSAASLSSFSKTAPTRTARSRSGLVSYVRVIAARVAAPAPSTSGDDPPEPLDALFESVVREREREAHEALTRGSVAVARCDHEVGFVEEVSGEALGRGSLRYRHPHVDGAPRWIDDDSHRLQAVTEEVAPPPVGVDGSIEEVDRALEGGNPRLLNRVEDP